MAGQSDLIERIARKIKDETPDDSSAFYVDYDDYAIHIDYRVKSRREIGGSYGDYEFEFINVIEAEEYSIILICREDGEDIPHLAIGLEKKLNA